jgi:hypothetical protein
MSQAGYQPAPRQHQRPPHEPFVLSAESHAADFASLSF